MSKFISPIISLVVFFGGVSQSAYAVAVPSLGPNAMPLSTPTTWRDIRDSRVTKQDIDYSCGASSLSTILTQFYGRPTTESQILTDMALSEMMASFADLARVSKQYGYDARGMMMDYDTLAKIKIPTIVYVNHKRSDHFSVVRAIDSERVYLADSSWGNRVLSRRQFEDIWLTTDDKLGKILLILPTTEAQKQASDSSFVAITQTQELLRQVPMLWREFL